MKEDITADETLFRSFCVDQLQRLSQFREFQFMSPAAQKDYRKWLERRGGTEERVRRIMDVAIELEAMPTIAQLNAIRADLFGIPFAEPEISLEERAARAAHLRDWYAQEVIEADKRRAAAIERAQPKIPVGIARVSEETIAEMIKAEQERRKRVAK